MGNYIDHSVEHLSFAIAETQTIPIDSTHSALVSFLDISAPAVVLLDISIGAIQVWRGWISTTPVQLNFGLGRGSGIVNEDITVIASGQSEVFVGIRKVEKTF